MVYLLVNADRFLTTPSSFAAATATVSSAQTADGDQITTFQCGLGQRGQATHRAWDGVLKGLLGFESLQLVTLR
jgi:hypothetical protein